MNDLHNKNGAKLCNAVGCRKHKQLISIYKGLFCAEHIGELSIIRENIKNTYNTNIELKYREEELLFRKVVDKGHMQCVLNLYKNKNKVLLSKMNKTITKKDNEIQNKNSEIINKTNTIRYYNDEISLLNNKIKKYKEQLTDTELLIYECTYETYAICCLSFLLCYYIHKYYI